MTREEFIKQRCEIDKITEEEFEKTYRVVKCNCGAPYCKGYRCLNLNDLLKENQQLKDNQNKLKEWLEKELGDRINPNKDKWLTGVYDAYKETIDKMQELEQGSDSDE